jgi:hypothetical protein
MTKQSNPAQGQEQTTPKTVSIIDLPFVKDEKAKGGKSRRNFWSVPKAESYGQACNAGRIYAREYLQYLQSSPMAGSGTTGWLVKGMAKCEGNEHGYAVGFFSALEEFLSYAAENVDYKTHINNSIIRSVEISAEAYNHE